MFFIYLLRKAIPTWSPQPSYLMFVFPLAAWWQRTGSSNRKQFCFVHTVHHLIINSFSNENICICIFKVLERALKLNKVTLAGLNQLPLSDSQHIKSEISPICSPEAGLHPGQVISPSQDTLLPPTLTNTTLQINFICLCLNWGREVPGENPHWTTHRKAQTGIQQCCCGLCYCLTARQVVSPDTTHFCTCSLCVCVWASCGCSGWPNH